MQRITMWDPASTSKNLRRISQSQRAKQRAKLQREVLDVSRDETSPHLGVDLQARTQQCD
jgi:hypothetical protein